MSNATSAIIVVSTILTAFCFFVLRPYIQRKRAFSLLRELTGKPFPLQEPAGIEGNYHVMPADIDPQKRISCMKGPWGTDTLDDVAQCVLWFCQLKGIWASFSEDELRSFVNGSDEPACENAALTNSSAWGNNLQYGLGSLCGYKMLIKKNDKYFVAEKLIEKYAN